MLQFKLKFPSNLQNTHEMALDRTWQWHQQANTQYQQADYDQSS
jgi:hypothetical protein